MRPYVKNKPIKLQFKCWYHCPSKTGYLYQFHKYLDKKKRREENLGSSVTLPLTECLEHTYCTIFYENFFNSPSLIIKLFDKGLYRIGTARMDRKGMSKMKPDKQMNSGDHEYQFAGEVAYYKWFDQQPVIMLFSNISGMQSTSIDQRRKKGSATKVPILCPEGIKMYNQSTGGANLVDQ